MCHAYFWEYVIPTYGTWPGWRCRRRWAWLGGLWHIWDHSQSILLKNWTWNMYHVCFWKYHIRRHRWAWLVSHWHIWDHFQSIFLEKLDRKHVSYMFLVVLTNSLSCFHWLSSLTSMGVSITPNRAVQIPASDPLK